jgi:putative effector of murein hydrolase
VVQRTDGVFAMAHYDSPRRARTDFELKESISMLWTILVVLLLLWLIGFYGGFVTNSVIHLLLIAAVVVLALNLFRRRNPA